MEINPDTLEIEIVDAEPIDGGVQVFARAWSDGQQIGFGTDGTVDIERFRIFNPPILVPDDNGDIIQEELGNEELGISGTFRRLREDPQQAILQSLVDTLSVMQNVHDGSVIVAGKRGNTTSSFYPAAGASSPVDGIVERSQTTTWQTLRDGTGTAVSTTTANSHGAYLRSTSTTNTYNLMGRGYFMFDTSPIGTDVISSATLSLYGQAVVNATVFGTMSVAITKVTTSSSSNLSNGDYNISNFGARQASDLAFGSFSTSAYNDFILNSQGLADINKTGITKYGTLTDKELDNSEPTWASNLVSRVAVYHADQTGTSQDPKLVVEHAAGGGATYTSSLMMMGMG